MKRIIWAGVLCLLPLLARADLRPPFNGITASSTLQSGTTFYVSSGTAVNFNASTATIVNLVATTTNDNALATSYGYSISSVTAANTNYPTTTQYGDLLSLPLAAGDWFCYGSCFASANGATVPEITCGVSQTSGNSSSGMVPGDSYSEGVGPTAVSPVAFSVLTRQSISSPATIYLKYEATFSVATPLARGKLFCWKPR